MYQITEAAKSFDLRSRLTADLRANWFGDNAEGTLNSVLDAESISPAERNAMNDQPLELYQKNATSPLDALAGRVLNRPEVNGVPGLVLPGYYRMHQKYTASPI
ncbi:hypothetical protein EC9_02480 [Rosistilla ulvae]|uniref:Uncharacterized protein n=1 Tax=Rosistilla ulvae TaxID=1930277 RepID=A0A517LTZ2_9BACT|nr:hypothetical protein EC9_02480 [Rosistilla ulvae]